MTRKAFGALLLMTLVAGLASCSRPYGYRFYPDVPRFAPTYPDHVELLRREPEPAHLRLGEVWVRAEAQMRRDYVDDLLKEQAARMGADAVVIIAEKFSSVPGYEDGFGRRPGEHNERIITGVAIRYRRR